MGGRGVAGRGAAGAGGVVGGGDGWARVAVAMGGRDRWR